MIEMKRDQGHTEVQSVNQLTQMTPLNIQAYERIKHEIITMSLRPGEYLNEAQISKTIGIGRTPVHQALNRLALERLVEVIPRKGYIVKAISVDEVMDVINVRIINEVYCAQLAAMRATKADIAQMERILEQSEVAGVADDTSMQMTLDKEFHNALSHAAGNQILSDIMRTLHDSSLRFWFISLRDQQHHNDVKSEHREVLEAIKKGDPEAAGAAIRTHIESFRANIQRYLTTGASRSNIHAQAGGIEFRPY
jgi:DNA-binding GntR family transcriptional regulator